MQSEVPKKIDLILSILLDLVISGNGEFERQCLSDDNATEDDTEELQ